MADGWTNLISRTNNKALTRSRERKLILCFTLKSIFKTLSSRRGGQIYESKYGRRQERSHLELEQQSTHSLTQAAFFPSIAPMSESTLLSPQSNQSERRAEWSQNHVEANRFLRDSSSLSLHRLFITQLQIVSAYDPLPLPRTPHLLGTLCFAEVR